MSQGDNYYCEKCDSPHEAGMDSCWWEQVNHEELDPDGSIEMEEN